MQFEFDFTRVPSGADTPEVQAVLAHPGRFRPPFAEWLTGNWHVWREFARMADRLWASGRRHWSSSQIIYYIRLQTALAERESEWKINQNNARDLATLYVLMRPGRDDFFEFRMRADTVRCRQGARAAA